MHIYEYKRDGISGHGIMGARMKLTMRAEQTYHRELPHDCGFVRIDIQLGFL